MRIPPAAAQDGLAIVNARAWHLDAAAKSIVSELPREHLEFVVLWLAGWALEAHRSAFTLARKDWRRALIDLGAFVNDPVNHPLPPGGVR